MIHKHIYINVRQESCEDVGNVKHFNKMIKEILLKLSRIKIIFCQVTDNILLKYSTLSLP